MKTWSKTVTVGVALSACATALASPLTATAHAEGPQMGTAQHVLLLSVDGMHQSDLDWYVHEHPQSALAALVRDGRQYTNAQTPFPSDSFPGMVGQVTGGNPRSTGVYYDDSFNKAVFPAGTSSKDCFAANKVAPGGEVTYFEAADRDPFALDAGQGLPGLPDSILNMTGNPTQYIDPAQLPVDPASCQPIYPHSYLRVNTIFEVARNAGLRTAWTDKHAAYEILNGPSGTGIQDLFTPEINSDYPTEAAGTPDDPHGSDWTKDNARTQRYDAYKVQSVINEINGKDHSGTTSVGVPAIFGMNFQTVSTAQKLLSSHTASSASSKLPGGYVRDSEGHLVPGPVVTGALDFVNAKVGEMEAALKDAGLDRSTAVILSAKHGQSPIDPAQLKRISDKTLIDDLNAAWTSAGHPGSLATFAIDDDGMLLWFAPAAPGATPDEQASFAADYLRHKTVTAKLYTPPGAPEATAQVDSYGLNPQKIYAGQAAADFMGVTRGDPRLPDLIGISQVGTVYTGGTKIAEHGGNNPADRHVPLVVSGAPVRSHGNIGDHVETTQIAPTILQLLGLNPSDLQAVRLEHTSVLPSASDSGADRSVDHQDN